VLAHIKSKNVSLSYLGAPNYRLLIEAADYKEAENRLKDVTTSATNFAKKLGVELEFKRK